MGEIGKRTKRRSEGERNEAIRLTQWNVVVGSIDSKQQSIELARVNSLNRNEKMRNEE